MQRQFNLQQSIHLAFALITMHAVALASLWSVALPFWALAALFFLLLASLLHHLRRNAWLSAPSSDVILTLDGKQAVLTTRDGGHVTGIVMHDSLVTPLFIVLNVLPQGSRLMRSAIFFPDRLDADSFRQLRVCLQWGC